MDWINYFDAKVNNSKFVKFLRSVDHQVTKNVKTAEVETRHAKSNGLWTCALLPIILTMHTAQYEVSPLYKLVMFSSIAIFFYCLLFTLFLSISSLILQENSYGGCISTSFTAILFTYPFLGYDFTFATAFSVLPVFTFSWLLRIFLNNFQNTFTIGEAIIVTQGIVLFGVMAVAKFVCNIHEVDEEMDLIYTVIFTVLSTVGLIVTALYLLHDARRDMKSLCYILAFGAAFALLMIMTIHGVNSPGQILHYVFIENDRYQLFTFWAFLVAIAVLVLSMRTSLVVKAGTVARKTFHVLASLVFLSGILTDERLMFFAAGVAFGLLILVEALRKANIPPVSDVLQSAFLVYSDEKDSGCFAVTPIYLYVGLSCPLALVPRADALALLSGVLSIGVGDTAASWFGSKYGFNKWSGGNRTYEGTAFNILSQIATVYALVLFELLDTKYALTRTAIAATVTGLVEAKTNQVDNLVLPLVMLIAFQATWFLN